MDARIVGARPPGPNSSTLASRKRIYIVFLAVALATATLVVPIVTVNDSGEVPDLDVPVFGVVFGFVAGLLWLQPSPRAYNLGLLVLGGAFVAYWLASPEGLLQALRIVDDPEDTRIFGFIALALFPVGWVLLATSVCGWKKGILSYLVTGLAHMLLLALLSGGLPPIAWLTTTVFWPRSVLYLLSVFGWD